jgi:CRISPR-associated endonuclease/helicase Cas3
MAPTSPLEFFRTWYARLTGYTLPFHWQEELFLSMAAGKIPTTIDLPTGSGKTSVIVIWLLALAYQAGVAPGRVSVPRRIVWVVDRRVVVDQASEEAVKLVLRLSESQTETADLRRDLRALCVCDGSFESPLAVSTLRGEREDHREWSENPTRPAIVVGTVDMIGSRLLFSGYGDSRKRRALHAGLLGQDALIVNDEAHLTPAFAALLKQLGGRTGGDRPVRIMLLTATHRDYSGDAFPANLDSDLADGASEFAKRYHAVKRLHTPKMVDKPKDEIRRLALRPDRRTVIFVRSPEEAQDLAAVIAKEHGTHVPLITGTQRGYERDRLLEDPVVKRFLSKEPPSAQEELPCWLVSTSAGEVGIDLSADRLITDLEPADHLLQRFGRLNRFGNTEGDAYLVFAEGQIMGDKDGPKRAKATLEYLRTLGGSVSPAMLRTRRPPAEASSKKPHLAPLAPWLTDVWSMTSINASDWPSRPPVEAWLHGDEKDASPETYVAWRKDVEDLADPDNGVTQSELEDVFDCYRVRALERLKQYTDTLCTKLRESVYVSRFAILIASDGEIFTGTLEKLLERPQQFRYATLLLPPGVGYLDRNGMVDWARATDKLTNNDLDRYDRSNIEGKRESIRVEPGEVPPATRLRLRCKIDLTVGDGDNGEGPRWLYFSGTVQKNFIYLSQLLDKHQTEVGSVAADLARQLGIDARQIGVFQWAGERHDLGKGRNIWQCAAGNRNCGPLLAKSGHVNGRLLDGYRHELGSLLDANDQLPEDFTPEERDIALHLIAAHHGWARPHFPEKTFDKTNYRRSEQAALEVARRFARLQKRYGPWGLAYLETIFCSADAIASGNAPEMPTSA